MMTKRSPMTRSPSPTSRTQRSVGLVEASPMHPCVELDVAAQVEAVGDMVGVTQDFGLRWRSARTKPTPAAAPPRTGRNTACSHVAARAGIAVPVPGAADALPASKTRTVKPIPRSRCSMYMPAKPAPTITASNYASLLQLRSADPSCFLRCPLIRYFRISRACGGDDPTRRSLATYSEGILSGIEAPQASVSSRKADCQFRVTTS